MSAWEVAADLRYAAIAKRYGMHNAYATAREARACNIGPALAYALVEQETGNGANIFGHDPTIYVGAGLVTKTKYLAYKRERGTTRMQGVGPLQLTWWSTQDAADRLGGCWIPRCNLRVGFSTLESNIKRLGVRDGIKAYNGSGSAADRYASSVLLRRAKWQKRLGV